MSKTLQEQLRIKAQGIKIGERISWGSEVVIMLKTAEKIDELEESLGRIANPVWWMQEDQKRETGSINGIDGALALRISKDPAYLSNIAAKALG